MSFNGDGPIIKRQRTDPESGQHRNHSDNYGSYGDEPRRKRPNIVLKHLHAMPTKEDSGDWFVEEMSDDERKGIEKNERDKEVVEKEMGTKKDEVETFEGKKDNIQKRQRGSENEKPNHVLLFTVINPVYPITVDVLHTICSPNGQVQRIVIFKKNGVQAMVDMCDYQWTGLHIDDGEIVHYLFDDVESAKRAKEALYGADIYSGCCTLKIDFAKPTKLNVYKNDTDSWDYTTPAIGLKQDTPSSSGRAAPLLAEPRFGAGPQPYTGRHPEVGSVGAHDPRNSFGSPMPALMYKGGESLRGPSVPPYAAAPPDRYEEGYQNGPGPGSFPDHFAERYPAMDRYSSTAGSEGLDQRYGSMKPEYGREPLHPTPPRPGYGPSALSQSQGGPGAPVPQQRSVMMVYGLDFDKVNADKLFNVFCLYGNIAKIKFLRTKEGCAMVQMGDSLSVERCLQNLNDVPLFDSTLQLGYSKQAFLSDSLNPWSLPDETPSFKDFINSRNNRFVNPAMASKNRIQPPSKILHFFNTPPNLTDEMLNKVFEEHNVTPPKTIKLFPLKNRSSSGLMEFEDVGQALEGLMMCNHVPIQNPGGFPYMMKLCFSSARSMATRERNNQKQQEMQEDE